MLIEAVSYSSLAECYLTACFFKLWIMKHRTTIIHLISSLLICWNQSISLLWSASVFCSHSLIMHTLTSLQKEFTSFCESSQSECVLLSSSALVMNSRQDLLNVCDEETSCQNLQKCCRNCFMIDDLRKQLYDLYTQYKNLCTVYNQRRDLNTQIQRTDFVDTILKKKMNVQIETEIHCQSLQHALSMIEDSRKKADKQQMIIIAKLINVLYNSQVVHERMSFDSRQEQQNFISWLLWALLMH